MFEVELEVKFNNFGMFIIVIIIMNNHYNDINYQVVVIMINHKIMLSLELEVYH